MGTIDFTPRTLRGPVTGSQGSDLSPSGAPCAGAPSPEQVRGLADAVGRKASWHPKWCGHVKTGQRVERSLATNTLHREKRKRERLQRLVLAAWESYLKKNDIFSYLHTSSLLSIFALRSLAACFPYEALKLMILRFCS